MHRKIVIAIYTLLTIYIFTACIRPVISVPTNLPELTNIISLTENTSPAITKNSETISVSPTPYPTQTLTPTITPTIVPTPTASEIDYEILNNLPLGQTGWWYTKSTRTLLEKYGGFCIKNTGDKHIYLAYNLGYEHGFTNKLLDMLQKKNVKATFFPIGAYVKSNENIIKRIVSEGHLLGSHGETHINTFASESPENIIQDIKKMQNSYKKIFGQDYKITYYRPPYGIYSEKLLYIAKQMGLISVFWSYTYADWESNKSYGKDYVYNLYMDNLHDGMIFQLHVATMDNISVLEDFVDEARRLGYEFYRVDEMK